MVGEACKRRTRKIISYLPALHMPSFLYMYMYMYIVCMFILTLTGDCGDTLETSTGIF